jgi:hypothetical protein
MSKRFPSNIIEQAQKVLNAWNQISTTLAFGTLNAAARIESCHPEPCSWSKQPQCPSSEIILNKAHDPAKDLPTPREILRSQLALPHTAPAGRRQGDDMFESVSKSLSEFNFNCYQTKNIFLPFSFHPFRHRVSPALSPPPASSLNKKRVE